MKGVLVDDNNELQIDVKRDNEGKITSGFVIGNIDYQRTRFIIEAQKGEFKEYPTLGFGIAFWLKSTTIQKRQQFINELQKELKSDGLKNAKVLVSSDFSKFKVEL